MNASIFLARLIGPVLALVGIGMLIDPAAYRAMTADFMNAPALLYLGAVLGLVAGVALVLTHNVWAGDWRLIVTMLGWIALIDSTIWLLVPRQAAAFWTPLMDMAGFVPVTGIAVLLLGAVLCYFGYLANRLEGRRA